MAARMKLNAAFVGTAVLFGIAAAHAFAQEKPPQCAVTFSVVRHDELGNTDAGLSNGDAKWYADHLAKKYKGICYSASGVGALLFDVTAKAEVADGHRTVSASSQSKTSGTITDQSGESADISAATTTDTDRVVPTHTKYLLFELDIKQRSRDGNAEVLRRFQQSDLYARTRFTFGFGKSAHPTRALLEEAVEWLAENAKRPQP